MPFLPDGTPVDIVLNPLGVPSRMNIGQILETHLGYVGRHLNCTFVNPAFEGSTEAEIIGEMHRLGAHFRRRVLENYVNSELNMGMQFTDDQTPDQMLADIGSQIGKYDGERLEEICRIVAAPPAISPVAREIAAGTGDGGNMTPSPEEAAVASPSAAIAGYDRDTVLARIKENAWARSGYDPDTGKTVIRDGLTGETFNMPVTVGVIYMLKLAHLVDDKIHARSTGPYSLVTQQPLGGKAQFGGQRFGEMEVWALEAYGAAYMLQEILTIKSDDVLGRVKTYESIVKGDNILEPGVPESFKILVNELQSLGLKVTVLDEQDKEIDLRDRDDDIDPNEDPVKAAARRRQRSMRLEPENERVI
jgi:DNA-directed RNA polymerase subunit beta